MTWYPESKVSIFHMSVHTVSGIPIENTFWYWCVQAQRSWKSRLLKHIQLQFWECLLSDSLHSVKVFKQYDVYMYGSMYDIFVYMHLIFLVNVSKYIIRPMDSVQGYTTVLRYAANLR